MSTFVTTKLVSHYMLYCHTLKDVHFDEITFSVTDDIV